MCSELRSGRGAEVGGGEERKVGGEGVKRKGKGKREGKKKNWSEDIYSHQSMSMGNQ